MAWAVTQPRRLTGDGARVRTFAHGPAVCRASCPRQAGSPSPIVSAVLCTGTTAQCSCCALEQHAPHPPASLRLCGRRGLTPDARTRLWHPSPRRAPTPGRANGPSTRSAQWQGLRDAPARGPGNATADPLRHVPLRTVRARPLHRHRTSTAISDSRPTASMRLPVPASWSPRSR